MNWEAIAGASAALSAILAAIAGWSWYRSRRFAARLANDVRVSVDLGTKFSDGLFFPFGLGTAGQRNRSDGETGIVISVRNASNMSIRVDDLDLRLGKELSCLFSAPECWQGSSPASPAGVTVEAGTTERFYISSSSHQGGSEAMNNISRLTGVYACGVDRWKASSGQVFKVKYEYFRNISPSATKKAYYRARHRFACD